MKKLSDLKNEDGFTLIEMMIVLLIISILLLIAVPNMTKSQKVATSKSCESTIRLIQSQVAAYNLEHEDTPLTNDLSPLVTDGYVESEKSISCPDGALELVNGTVQKSDGTTP